MNKSQYLIRSPIGPIYLVASAAGLCSVSLEKLKIPLVSSLSGGSPELKFLLQASSQLKEYFQGVRSSFDIKLDIHGTKFQKLVWQQLRKIPYGKTCSYKDIAIKIKNQGAVRAVGSANGKNNFCIIIPCHRVIAADGSLGGYSGGLNIKTKLLELESKNIF